LGTKQAPNTKDSMVACSIDNGTYQLHNSFYQGKKELLFISEAE
jgi:hypothetical protein